MLITSIVVHLLTLFAGCHQRFLENEHQTLFCSSLNDFYNTDIVNENLKQIEIIGRGGARETLKEFSFKKCANLTRMSIENAINVIELGAFDGLNHIEDLAFSSNHFPILKAKLFDLVATSLLIYNCNVKEIEPNTFGNIRNIFISYNSIKVIKNGIFTNTATSGIQLNNNKIEIIEKNAFSEMPNLKYLDLSGNHLKKFYGPLIFNGAKNLKLLNLQNNKLSKIIKNTFPPNLEILILQGNSIKKIEYESFLRLTKLQFLDLSNNLIEELHASLFNFNNKVDILFLNDNFLSFLSNELLSQMKNVKNISLVNNNWQCSCIETIDIWIKQKGVVELCKETSEERYCIEGAGKCFYQVKESKEKFDRIFCAVPNWRNFKIFNDF